MGLGVIACVRVGGPQHLAEATVHGGLLVSAEGKLAHDPFDIAPDGGVARVGQPDLEQHVGGRVQGRQDDDRAVAAKGIAGIRRGGWAGAQSARPGITCIREVVAIPAVERIGE